MDIILLERVHKLGAIGDVVKVKDGYARNFLLPSKKALRATKANLEVMQVRKAELEAINAEKRAEAEKLSELVKDVVVTLIRQAGDDGRLYGSIAPKEIAEVVATKSGVEIKGNMIVIETKIKEIGSYTVNVMLHAEVSVPVTLNISRGGDTKLASVAA